MGYQATAQPVKNIIFDFGGVFLNIDFQLTFDAFRRISGANFEQIFPQGFNDQLLLAIETGIISPEAFRIELCERIGKNLTDNQIDIAWNALLLDLPHHRIEMLRQVALHYRVFLLSNTNLIHYLKYNGDFRREYGINFDQLFEKAYWSHELGLRKPSSDCYEAVLADAGIHRAETVFIDDSPPNIVGAAAVGLQVIHLTADVAGLFSDGVLKQ